MGPPMGPHRCPIPKMLTHQEIWRECPHPGGHSNALRCWHIKITGCALLYVTQKLHLQDLTSDVSILSNWEIQVKESEVIQQSYEQPLNTYGKVYTWQEKVQSLALSTAAGSFLSIYLSRIRKLSWAFWQSQANILYRDATIIPLVPGNTLLPSLPSCPGGV